MDATTGIRILGADGREYGPVGIQVVKKWIAEGRALGPTLARPEDQDSWKPLHSFVEFTTDFALRAIVGNDPPMGAPPRMGAPPAAAPAIPAQKSKIAAGLLGIFVGGFGVHRFYLGYFGAGMTLLSMTLLSWLAVPLALFGHRFAVDFDRVPIAMFICAIVGGAAHLWGFIEGVLILCGASIRTDAQGRPLKD